MLTGIRHDAWADAHRIPVDQWKPDAEQGTYLEPRFSENRGKEPAQRERAAARTRSAFQTR